MRSTLRDAQTILTKPRNIAIAAGVLIVSAVWVYLFGYPMWRRFVMPTGVIATALIGRQIAATIKQAAFAMVVTTASNGLFTFAVALYAAATIDNLFFGDVGYAAFIVNALMWTWVPFQMYRLYLRLADMPPTQRKLVTDSADVALAHMNYRIDKIDRVLNDAAPVFEKYGMRIAAH